jgi:SOUL heme-binding protein
MRKILLVASAIAIILVLALLLTQSFAETTPYSIKGTTGEIEFRHYPGLVLATVDTTEDNAGFNLLFNYISGSNKARDTIPMTAPVITSQKIPMTSPVVSDAASMSFVMPAGKTREETPDPLDSRVRIVTLPEREVAVIRFTGYASPQEVDAVTVRLRDGLNKGGIETVGQPFLMRYDTPWMPGFLRHNEVGIEIKRS